MTEPDDPPTVLIVEDEPQMLQLYRDYLDNGYSVRTAISGEEAFEQYDDSIDLVLLDRRMPGMSGDEVLAELRDRGFDGPIAMVSAVDPDVDIVDLSCDDYLVKPSSKEEFTTFVSTLLRRATYDTATRKYLATVTKLAILESKLSATRLEESAEYRALTDRVDALRERARTSEGLTPEAIEELVEELVRDIV